MKFKMLLDMGIEFDMPEESTKEDAIAYFFEELSYVESGELIYANYDIHEK